MPKIKKQRFFGLLLFFFAALTLIIYLYFPARPTQAVEEQELSSEPKSRTIEGIHFKVPEDWPIEDRGGSLAPIPVEEYVGIKFAKYDSRIAALEASLKGTLEENKALKDKVEGLETTVMSLEERLIDLEQWLKLGRARKN